ncbi:hypothetical protein D1614_09910 [Maribellus luteus]|uniref:Uncharacterized protein n=1 Tax=Maribellus luteus TaxID=2305463 RepID=A0A399SXM0_9BACT|nr:hypothetical protein D1614_09910 [Maribellus luteus]
MSYKYPILHIIVKETLPHGLVPKVNITQSAPRFTKKYAKGEAEYEDSATFALLLCLCVKLILPTFWTASDFYEVIIRVSIS